MAGLGTLQELIKPPPLPPQVTNTSNGGHSRRGPRSVPSLLVPILLPWLCRAGAPWIRAAGMLLQCHGLKKPHPKG